jgi:hypothetical protein
MADYHITSADQYGNRFTVVMHFPVPNTLNEAGVNYRAAVVEYQGGAPIESVLPSIGAEQTALDAGEIIERVYPFNSNPNETPAQKQARLDAMWSQKKTQEQTVLENVLSYWGFNRTVP